MVYKSALKKSENGVITTSKLVLTLNKDLLLKIEKKAKRLGCSSPQQYIYEIIRRDINRKRVGGRPNEYVKAANVMMMKKVLTTKGGKPFKI